VYRLAHNGHLDVHGFDLQPRSHINRSIHRHYQTPKLSNADHEIPREVYCSGCLGGVIHYLLAKLFVGFIRETAWRWERELPMHAR
jgi:hypothetical protein